MWITDPMLEMSTRLGAPWDGRARAAAFGAVLSRFESELEAERDRLALWLAVGLGAGILVYFALPAEPPLGLGFALLGLAIAFVWVGRGRRLLLEGGAILLLSVAAGFLCAEIRTRTVSAPVLAGAVTGTVEGRLVSLDAGSRGGQKALIQVMTLEHVPQAQWPRLVRITIHNAPARLRAGDVIRLRGHLEPPAGPAAPGAYDFAMRSYFQGIGAVGYALAAPELIAAAAPESGLDTLLSWIERGREDLGARIAARLDGTVSGVAIAFTTGLRTDIPKDANNALRNSGLYHLISISGVHMSAVALALFFALRLALASIPPIALRYPIKKWAAGLSIAGAFVYLIFTGCSVPTVRSFVMVALVFLAVMTDRRALTMRNVALSAALILILLPESVLDVSFQMSYAATMALIATFEEWRARRQETGVFWLFPYFAAMLMTGLVAGIATAPFSLFHFQTATPLGLIANLIAIPLTDLLIMPAAFGIYLLAPLGWEAPAVWILGKACAVLLWAADVVSKLPGAVQGVPAGTPAALVFMTFGGLWLMLWRRPWRRFAILPVLAGVFLWTQASGPDILVDREIKNVAARGEDGRLGLIEGSSRAYAIQNWLRRDGATLNDGGRKTASLRCDSLGCVAPLKGGGLLALSRDSASLADDCAHARVLISTGVVRVPCNGPALIIDRHMTAGIDVLALRIEEDTIEAMPTALAPGTRPWAPARRVYYRREYGTRPTPPAETEMPVDERASLIP
jgi:competence protein ComEC